MPIKNYTTSVNASKTVGQIQQILAQAGARNVAIAYDEKGMPKSVDFAVDVGDRRVYFRLPSDWRAVQKVLEKDGVRPSYRTEAHARMVAWRITKDWIDAQMAFLRSRQVSLAELFFPHAVNPQTGETLYKMAIDEGFLLEEGGA